MANYKEISELYHSYLEETNSLCHHGIKGQKWGVRRFQNEDGTLTNEGKVRYNQETASKVKDIAEKYEKAMHPDINDPKDLDNFCLDLKNRHGIDKIPEEYWGHKPENKKYSEIDNSADLGIKALKNFNKNLDTEYIDDLSKQDLRDWFIFEDQTIGLIEISRLINAGYPGSYVKKLFDQLGDDKFLDKMYEKKYPKDRFADDLVFAAEMTWYNKENVRDKYIDECEKIFKSEYKPIK